MMRVSGRGKKKVFAFSKDTNAASLNIFSCETHCAACRLYAFLISSEEASAGIPRASKGQSSSSRPW